VSLENSLMAVYMSLKEVAYLEDRL